MRTITHVTCTALMITFVVGCQNAGKATPSSTDKVYDLRATIMSIDKEKNTVMLDHEDIPGLMRAMKMSFPRRGRKTSDRPQGRRQGAGEDQSTG